MEYTNFTMVNMLNTLAEFDSKKLPQKISYAITRNLILLQQEYPCYEQSMKKLFDRYSADFIRGEDGEVLKDKIGVPIIKKESQDDFNKELAELLNTKIDLDLCIIAPETFDYSDENNRYDPMSPSDIIRLQSVLCKKGE